MERPDRVVVELPRGHFPACRPNRAGAGRVWWPPCATACSRPERSRVVIDLAQPALVSRLDVATRPADGAALLTVELARSDREAFRAPARPETPAVAEPATTGSVERGRRQAPASSCIDAGHGGIDPGAVASTGALEKDIVFSFAQRLRERLEGSGRYRVAMTRDHDVFIPLDERVRVTRAAKADLFISIHADSISGGAAMSGAAPSIPARSARPTPNSRTLAERENKADAAAGLDSRDTRRTRSPDILQELTLRETRGFSHRFAKKLVGELDPVMRLNKKPHRRGGLQGAARPRRALGPRRARLSVEPAGSRPPHLRRLAGPRRPPRWRRRSTSSSRTRVANQGPATRRAPQFHHRCRVERAGRRRWRRRDSSANRAVGIGPARRHERPKSRRTQTGFRRTDGTRTGVSYGMRFVLRFFGFLFSVGAIFFLIGAVGAGLRLLEILAGPARPRAARQVRAAGDDPRPRRRRQPARRICPRAAALHPDPGGARSWSSRAFLSAEDKNFYKHSGIDPEGLVRAVVINFKRGGKRQQGASTITQQVAKNFLLSQRADLRAQDPRGADRAADRKRPISKDRILELYLNEIYLGLEQLRHRRGGAELFRQVGP